RSRARARPACSGSAPRGAGSTPLRSAFHADGFERALECGRGRVVDTPEPGRTGQHEGEPAFRLLVAAHQLDELRRVEAFRRTAGQTERGHDLTVPLGGRGVD